MSATLKPQPTAESLREQQLRQAEELLFTDSRSESIAKALFTGQLADPLLLPYPELSGAAQRQLDIATEQLCQFCDHHLDPVAIDRDADIPADVIAGLGRVGLLGMTAPESVGGRGFSQLAYCQLLQWLGGRCSATSILVNAHHSIGMRGLLLFGTDSQQQRWLPDLVAGRKLAAFALTETEAGSDAGNVQTTATPSADGSHYVLHGSKRYITNGAIAGLLTVMARTPVPDRDDTALTAFLVTPDMPGFRIVEPRMEKLGIRGTATAKLAFENMVVPTANVLGKVGKGLRIALTVLDFGRTTFGACCTGAAETCLQLARDHACRRVQFGQPLAAFEAVQQKLACMAAKIYAMQAMTHVTAGLIDRGSDDYMLETAILKVWTTERLWEIVNDAFQIHGGAAYFTDLPLERMLRDARINQIGEGANEVLVSFIAMVGMRQPGEALKSVAESLQCRRNGLGTLARFTIQQIGRRLRRPTLSLQSAPLRRHGKRLGRLTQRFGNAVQMQLIRHRQQIVDRQLVHAQLATAAMELYASACVLSRRDQELQSQRTTVPEPIVELFLTRSDRTIRGALEQLRHLDTPLVRAASDAVCHTSA